MPLAVPISVITKARSEKDESHSISDINLVNLKNAIENPIAVIENNERNAFVFVTNLKENGKYIIIGFEKSTLFDGDRVHKATSIHSREDMTEYFNNLNNSEIYSLNENKLTVVSGSSIDLERLKQNNKFTKIKIPQQNEFVKDFSLRDLTPAQKVARRILKDYNSKADLSEVSDALSKIYTNGVSNSSSEINSLAEKITNWIVEDARDNNNRLYLAVALTKIETGVKGNTASQNEIRTSLPSVSTISISDLFEKINYFFRHFRGNRKTWQRVRFPHTY